MKASKINYKRLRVTTAVIGGVSLLCSLFHFIQQDGMKNNNAYYLDIYGIDAFMIFAVTLMIFATALFIIDRKSNVSIEQKDYDELHYAQYRANNRLILALVLAFLPLFIISQGLNSKNGIEMNAFSLSVVLLALAIDVFLTRNIIFYFKHRELVKEREEKSNLHVWVQLSFFLTSQILWMYISSVFDIVFIEKMKYVIVPLFFIGILGVVICLATLRARGSKIRAKRMTWIDVGCLKRATYVFLIFIATVFALACIVIP